MVILKKISKEFPVIAWWSGGITSAITCWLCILWFGVENVRVIFIDTHNEDDDTYRFKNECEKWYGCNIESIYSLEYKSIQEVWYKHLSLNTATGAVCSYKLKRLVREEWQRNNKFSYQAFGFDINEISRAEAIKINHPSCYPFFPLIAELIAKKKCFKLIEQENNLFCQLKVPRTYFLGYHNNNCFKTGCVQGGIGYWQKIGRERPPVFDSMANVEHELTDLKGQPVTMLRTKKDGIIFLKPHPKYPKIKDISMVKGREPQPIFECNGLCGTNDLMPNKKECEINYQEA